MFIKIPAMIGISVTSAFFRTVTAFFIFVTEIFSEYLKPVLPDIFETVCKDISLNKLRTAFNIKTGCDITVCHYTCDISSGSTYIVPITHFTFIFHAKIMTATVCNRFPRNSLVTNIFKHIAIIVICKNKFRMLFCTSDRLNIDNSPTL